MKKLTAITLAAAMVLPCATVSAEETSRVNALSDKLYDNSGIHILYNDAIVEYEDVKPVNNDGRVMIPFRAVLESMGAQVDYDEENRLVTANKDETTIKFTLMDDIIYIDRNGKASTITMDTPMIIVEDRTLVPIRFMSNALDMQVGWDGETQTVLVADFDDYFDKLETIAPNLSKLMNMEQTVYNKEYSSFDISVKINENIFALNGAADSAYADNASQANVKLNGAYNETEIENSETNAFYKVGKLYLKTDLIEKIAEKTDNAELKAVALVINGDNWCSFDLAKIIDALPVPDEAKTVYKNLLSKTTINKEDTIEMLKSGFVTEGDVSYGEMISLAGVFDAYEYIDKFISVTEKENGGYTVSIDITKDDFLNMFKVISGGQISDEAMSQLKDSLEFSISASSDADNDKATSNVDFAFAMKTDGELSITMKITAEAEKDENVKIAQAPADSVDMTDLIVSQIGSLK